MDLKDIKEIVGIAGPEDNASLEHFKKDLARLQQRIEKLEFNSLLGGEDDSNNAIVYDSHGSDEGRFLCHLFAYNLINQ